MDAEPQRIDTAVTGYVYNERRDRDDPWCWHQARTVGTVVGQRIQAIRPVSET